ncbi:MAG: peptidase S41 [Bacteroidetes bacterium]|nr:peptidase S41 [Bacteroidota bacterium]
MNKFSAGIIAIIFLLCSCSAGRNTYSPSKKFDQQHLQEDYSLLRKILEQKHPSLYWYSSKDSMDYFFSYYYAAIKDSMTEQQFAWQILAPLVDKIKCGHTSVSMSKAYANWVAGKTFPSFPLYMKVWNDTMLTMINLNKNDSIIKKGTIITAINGKPAHSIINEMFNYLPQDGNANTINYIRVSANFPYYHRNIYGLSKNYAIDYIGPNNQVMHTSIPAFGLQKDSAQKTKTVAAPVKIKKQKKPSRQKRMEALRSLTIDSSNTYAVMTIGSFTKGHLRKFFRQSFKALNEKNISNLILDVRLNGGGRVALSTLLARYVSRQKFKVADSLFSPSRSLAPYTKYIKGKFFNNIEMFFISKKKSDGNYHITYLEKKTFKPKKQPHYNGKLYVLTSGPTFSAATLFCNIVKGQEGITLLGEETGGGWYGNNGIMIPDIKLPNTKITVRLPLYRMVQYKHPEQKGTGIVPDIYVGTSYDALMKGYDMKMKTAIELIRANKP